MLSSSHIDISHSKYYSTRLLTISIQFNQGVFMRRLFAIAAGAAVMLLFSNVTGAAEDATTALADPQWKVPGSSQNALIPNISLVGSFAGGFFRDDPAGDQGENPSRTGFNLQGLELGIQSVIDPYVRGDIFILFHEDGIEVEDATVTTLSLPWNFQIRAGKMLGKFGRQNSQHLEQVPFVDTSLANRYFFNPDGFSEVGVELSNLLPLPWYSEATFQFLQGENAGNFDGPRKQDFAYLGRWVNQFDPASNLSVLTGLSGAFGFNSSAPGNRTEIYGADLYLRWRPSARRGLKWQTEYFLRRKQVIGDMPVEGGLYSQFVWQFARRWEAGLRADLVGFPEDTVKQEGGAASLAFLATEFFRLRAQYEAVHTPGARLNHEAFLQLQFNMGPHGAHAF